MRRLIITCVLSLLSLGSLAETRLADGWIKQLPPSVPMRAGYFTINNNGTSADRLLSASSPAFNKIEMHETRMADGMMSMNQLMEVPVDAGVTVEFKPGGLHLMLMGIKQPLEVGDKVPVTLTFESGEQTIELEVRK